MPIDLQPYADYYSYVTELIRKNNATLGRLVPAVSEYEKAWGGTKRHHDYPGGLLVHTCEVVQGIRLLGGGTEATFAALWHDWGKTLEYGPGGEVRHYRYEIGHVMGSVMELQRRYILLEEAFMHKVLETYNLSRVYHIMAAHHGRYEWKSPVLPRTSDAFRLHAADMMSMNHGRIHEGVEPTPLLVIGKED